MGTILIDNTAANESLSRTGTETEGLAGKFGASFDKMKKLAIGLGIGVAVKKSFDVASQAVTEFADKGDDIDKMSQKFSMSAEAFQQWESIAGHNGTSIEMVGKAIKEITISAEDNAEAYENMGIAMKNTTDGSMRDSQDIFKDTILALSDMEAGTERDAKAKELLGGKYQELLPLINGGRDAILEQLEASESAVTMTDEQVKKAAAFKDAQQAMQEQIDKVKMALTENLVPALVALMDWVTEHMPQIQAVTETVFKAVGDAVAVVSDNLDIIIPVLAGAVAGFVAFEIVTGISAAMAAFSAVTEGTTGVTAALNAVMAANPFVMVALAIAGIVTAGVLLYQNWDTVKAKAEELFAKMQEIWDGITTWVTTSIDALITNIVGFAERFKEDGKELFNKLWEGLKEIWLTISSWVTTGFDSVITTIKGFGTKMFDAGKEIMGKVWDGLKEKWTDITGWISNRATEIADTLMFWKKSKEDIDDAKDDDGDDGADGSHANGLSYVPFDGYKAILHKGERVVTAEDNKTYGAQKQGDFIMQIANVTNSKDRDIYDLLRAAEFYKNQKTAAVGG